MLSPIYLLKYLTAIIGFSFFGFFGGIAGYFAGSAFTNWRLYGSPTAVRNSPQRQAQQQLQQQSFIETVFKLMGALAKADSRVSEQEIAQAEQAITAMNLGAQRAQAIAFFKAGVEPSFDLNAQLNGFMEVCKRSAKMKHMMLIYLISIAVADGQIHPAEDRMLREVATKLGYGTQAYELLLSMVLGQSQFSQQGAQAGQNQYRRSQTQARNPNNLANAYQALGVKQSDSNAVIKKAYRKLISEFHPDKLIGQGVPKEMVEVATKRTQEIQTAYQLIQDSRNQ